MSKSRVRVSTIFVCTVLLCTLALAADQKSPTKLSDLPPDAQQAISAALARNSATIQHFTLTASDGANGDGFGVSVAIDGNTVIVGGAIINGNQEQGVAYVFVKPPSGWTNMTQTAELTASDGQPLDGFGSSVAISGSTVVVGALDATVNGNPDQGAAYVFVKPASGWVSMTETAKLTASDGADYDELGASVSISSGTVIVGAPQYPGPGAAYVFVEPGGGWTDMTQTAELAASDGADYYNFGVSVSINDNTIIVGASQDGCSCNAGPGEAYVFVEPKTGWMNTSETAKLTASDGAVGDNFGFSVSVSGTTAVVSAQGAAYVFVEPGGGWVNMTQTAELTGFGGPVSIDGNVILWGDAAINRATGAAFVFLKPVGGWRNTSKYNLELGIPFPYGYDMFGRAVAVGGTTGIIGAPNAPTSPPCGIGGVKCQAGPGEAFVFTEK
jgi:hypothetical protein